MAHRAVNMVLRSYHLILDWDSTGYLFVLSSPRYCVHPWSHAFYGIHIPIRHMTNIWVSGSMSVAKYPFMHIVLILCICTMLMLYKYVRVFLPRAHNARH